MRAAGEIAIRWARDEHDIQGALALRERVFCGEQGVPVAEELDGRDDEALHLVAVACDEDAAPVIGTLRLLVDGARGKIGRVAVERAWRRRGVAARMLELAVARARERGCAEVRLAAQLAAIDLYAQAGFTVDSDTFEEAGIAHVWMGLTLTGTG